MYEVIVPLVIEESLSKIHMTHQKEIRKHLHLLKNNPDMGKELSNEFIGFRSLNVGDYRIIYKIEEKEYRIIVAKIGHRRDIYIQS